LNYTSKRLQQEDILINDPYGLFILYPHHIENKKMNIFWRLLRYEWPLHLILFFTNWMPDNVVAFHIRGILVRPFFASCGKNLRLARNITFYNPYEIQIGKDVYIANGCWIAAGGFIRIEDEVLFGPYVVLSANNHTRLNGSFRFGKPNRLEISIGRGSWISAHATILGGVTIGSGSLIASGATVVRGEYPADSFLAGVPAVIKKTVRDDNH
jgi:acetyltransferase-like isoleucine patch superfamily enzyme